MFGLINKKTDLIKLLGKYKNSLNNQDKMICIISLIVFSILGIFSVRYRKLAAEAFDCVFRRITLRPCQSGLDQRMKSNILGFFSKKNIKLARAVAKYFELLSWIFLILMVVSMFFTARGIYFYVVYGNCNGLQGGFCVFDALNPTEQTEVCSDPSIVANGTKLTVPSIDDDPSIGPEDAKVTIIEFGCFSCPYTKVALPVVKEILKKYEGKIRFVYRDFHIELHEGSKERAAAAECADDQNKYWEYSDKLFEMQEQNLTDDKLIAIASSLGLNPVEFELCLKTGKYLDEVDKDFLDGRASGVYGTPTFFINNVTVVGPKPFRYFKNIIDSELK